MHRLISLLLLTASFLAAQIQGSLFDPQIAELTVEGRFPNGWILTTNPNLIPAPPEVAAGLASGALEIRARIEYNRPARLMRVFQLIVPRGTPMPLPQSPGLDSPAAGLIADVSIDLINWFEYPSAAIGGRLKTLTIVGKVIGSYRPGNASEGETVCLTVSFNKDNPRRLGLMTITFAGEVTGGSPEPAGIIRLEAPRQVTP